MARPLAARARGGLRRLAGSLPRPASGSDEVPERSDSAEVAELRKRLRRTRRALGKQKDEVQRLRQELRAGRASLRDPFPDRPTADRVTATIDAVTAESLTYLSTENLAALASVVEDAEARELPGLVIEAGTALGGSAIVLAAAKRPDRPMKVYDVFGMIPEPTDQDGADVLARYETIRSGGSVGVAGTTYYGYRDDLLAEVTASFARHGVPLEENRVELVKGLFQDTIDLDEPVAFAHLDGDWYESTMVCLERIAPLLVTGGRIVLDDYYKWSGCRTAVDEYFANRAGFRIERRAKIHVVRT